MTGEKEIIYGSGQAKRKAYLSYLPIAAFLICIAAGTYLGGDGGAIVRLDNPFHKDVSFSLPVHRFVFGILYKRCLSVLALDSVYLYLLQRQ